MFFVGVFVDFICVFEKLEIKSDILRDETKHLKQNKKQRKNENENEKIPLFVKIKPILNSRYECLSMFQVLSLLSSSL